jgi:ACS family D-galactonate transporter-like MFS transporter
MTSIQAARAPAARLHAPRGASRVRHGILVLITIATVINYLDRTVLGIAAPTLTKELQIDPFWLGIAFSAFSWTYAFAQLPGGIFLDRFGARFTYFLSMVSWSAFTLLQGVTAGLTSLLVFRLGLGISEAPCFPANARICGTWFPQHERARANGVYSIGQYVGLAVFGSVLVWIMTEFGWRALFFLVGSIGVLFGFIFAYFYRDPDASTTVNQAELDHIAAGGGLGSKQPERTRFAWSQVVTLLKYRQIVGACLGQFGGNSTMVFFLTWFPTYLATERHMSWLKSGFLPSLPFLAAAVGVLFGGWASDKLLTVTGSANIARKTPLIVGLLGAATIIGANYVDDNRVVIAIMSFAFFCQGMTNLGWTLIADIAPKNLMGVTGGVFNFAANVAGIATPVVIGAVVSATGSFFGGLVYTGAVALVGALSYVFIVGDVRRIEDIGPF